MARRVGADAAAGAASALGGPAPSVPAGLQRRRLLFLLPFPPRPDATHGGARAMAHIVGMLATRHEVAVLYLRGADEAPIDGALASRCALVEEVPRDPAPTPWARARHSARRLAAQLRGVPWWPADCAAGPFGDHVRRLAEEWRPDLVHLEYFAMGYFARVLASCPAPRVLTSYEPYSAAAAERAGSLRGPAAWRARMETVYWRRYERDVMARVDAVVGFTERDQQALTPLAGATRVVHIPLGTPVPERALDPVGSTPAEVLFVGNFIHPPNVDAALWLIRDIAPLLWKRAPEARVVIVGPRPPDVLRSEGGDRTVVTGAVEDVTPYLERAAVVVAPLRLGGGMRVKVLEALAAGKAVVATPRAVEGLDVSDGAQVRIAGDEAAFAEAIAELAASPERRASLGSSARAWACERFGDARWADAYDALYRTVDRGASRPDAQRRPRELDAEGIVRSADWRFLLPRPASGRFARLVVLGGTRELLDGLRRLDLASDLSATLPSDRSASAVVVLPGAPVMPDALGRALADGGALYVEVDRRSAGNWRWSPSRLAAALGRSGLASTGLYAVGRRGLAPRRYMPLDDPGPGRWFLRNAYRPVTAAQRLAGLATSALLGARLHRTLLHPILPAYAITAVSGRGASTIPLAYEGAAGGAGADLVGARAVLFGDGGDRVVVLPFAPGAALPAAVLKVPRSAGFRGRTENEQERMRELRARLPADLARAIPEPRGIVSDGDVYASVEQALPGRTLLASSGHAGAGTRRRRADLRAATEWLAAFHRASAIEQRAWGAREVREWVDEPFERFAASYGTSAAESRLRAMAVEYARALEGLTVPLVWQHRDYAVWNIARQGDALAVLDWEGARPGPPLCDMLYLVNSWDIAIRRPAGAREELDNFRALFLEPPGRDEYRAGARREIKRYLTLLGLGEAVVPVLLLHLRLELAIRRADQLQDRGAPVAHSRTGNDWVAAVELLAERADHLFPPRR